MNLKPDRSVILAALIVIAPAANANQDLPRQVENYRLQGALPGDPERGRKLWNSTVNQRSCTNCHGDDPAGSGKHVKTGKPIRPMALSANPTRYRKAKKVEKWFLRNCKWTLGRECSLQEKTDILTWLASQ